MKRWSVVENGRPLECIEYPDPVPQGREVFLEVSHCGVCHSDLHFWHGSFDLGGGNILKITDRGVKLPCAPGHEIVGRVAALGPEARGVSVGDRRIVYPWIGCGACEFCRSDRENLCYKSSSLGIIRDGGFATHVTVPDSTYLFEYGDLDPALAATFACSGLTVYSAIRKLQPLDPERAILVVGAGGLGLAAVSMLRAMDHSCIILLDTCPDKRAAALAAGASFAFDNATPEIQQSIAGAAGGPLLAAIDFVNRSETVGVALEALGKGGRLVLVGVGGGEYRLSLAGLIFRPRSIIGSITGSRQELREVIALAEQGRLAPIPITRMPRDEVNQAMRRLESGGVVGRIVLS